MKLGTQQKADQDHTIFMIELQILVDAEQMFKLLKNYSWQKRDHMIHFHEKESYGLSFATNSFLEV